MSRENVERLRRANAAFNRGDGDGAFAPYHDDVQWRDLQHPPDMPERMRGRAALLANWEQWNAAFDDFTAEIERYIDVGTSVVAVTRWRARGKDSGITIDLRTVDVYEFADGKIVRATIGYPNEDAARKALGQVG